jgi:hypothetical protein
VSRSARRFRVSAGLEHPDPGAQRGLQQLVIAVVGVAAAVRAARRHDLALRIQELSDRQ